MIATVRISLDIPDEKAKAALERAEPGASRRWDTARDDDRWRIAEHLQEWVQDDIPGMLANYATGDEVEVDW